MSERKLHGSLLCFGHGRQQIGIRRTPGLVSVCGEGEGFRRVKAVLERIHSDKFHGLTLVGSPTDRIIGTQCATFHRVAHIGPVDRGKGSNADSVAFVEGCAGRDLCKVADKCRKDHRIRFLPSGFIARNVHFFACDKA